ncbi:uncharacterized protein YndB with AHSA1/START domain [Actinoalloteichus hoggarensis]|uniref:Activator of Hsp90 ATPase homologue 1/2-like C-terminal domain-containing protein n=1 Tax=Actinoalloteichus hoggarensis TaxID=1470176 RepID=A0A221VZW0_9PSEU|nr:SRPBCC domain-containing protein [Actinoalloteichus hoggarensis]ASO19063.1 hypothetical protein AHOG_07075 [Actinoalloteichus hoggarensis]MBB5920301.1 uncharacterized protein YndB with AHSA1/START domain [Actinoalloteichus hoggarensis]
MTTRHASRRGTLGVTEDGRFRVHLERRLPYTPALVWEWIADPGRLARWLPGSRIDATVGGEVRFDFGEEGTATGTVLEAVPPGADGRLTHTWVWAGVPESTVRWTVTAGDAGEGSVLTVVHSEVLREPAADFAAGWHVMLDALELIMAGDPADAAWGAMEEIAGLYPSS